MVFVSNMAYLITTISLDAVLYSLLKTQNTQGIVSYHLKDVILASTVLYSIVALVYILQTVSIAVKSVLMAKWATLLRSVVASHLYLGLTFIALVWFELFKNITQLNNVYTSKALKDNALPTALLVFASLTNKMIAAELAAPLEAPVSDERLVRRYGRV